MPNYKLTYFDARGAAEPIRLILTYAGQKFEDVRLPMGGLTQEKKKELPWGQVPVLEVDGEIKTQSFAIARFLAKRYNLAGKNEKEQFRCDEIAEATRDLYLKMSPMVQAFFAKDTAKLEELKKVFIEVDAPATLKRFNDILEKNGKTYFVGDSLTYPDILFAHLIFQFDNLLNVSLAKNFPGIEKLTKAINNDSKLKQWLEKRPKTVM